tara:strand:+ start:2156 stop:2830 length:675 start_codon:yes stop_codon:yes gene_type:complete
LREQFGVLRAELRLDAFATAMKSAIDLTSLERWHEISYAAQRFAEFGIELKLYVNGKNAGNFTAAEPISKFLISGRLVRPESLEDDAAKLMKIMVEVLAEIVTAGLGWKEDQFETEGAKHLRAVTTYERSPINRQLAIQIHGSTCKVCGFNFAKTYGRLGDGVVEIHHKTPVHLMKQQSVVDPRTELVPLCSNCHTMVHRVDPPIPIEELARVVESQTQSWENL